MSVKYINDLDREMVFTSEEFAVEVESMIEWAVERGYELSSLTSFFMAHDIVGIMQSNGSGEHGMPINAMVIINNVLTYKQNE